MVRRTASSASLTESATNAHLYSSIDLRDARKQLMDATRTYRGDESNEAKKEIDELQKAVTDMEKQVAEDKKLAKDSDDQLEAPQFQPRPTLAMLQGHAGVRLRALTQAPHDRSLRHHLHLR